MWKSEPESVKSTFKDMAKRKEAEHKQAYPEYKYTPRVTEKSMKARQKAKGVRKIATGRAQVDMSGEQPQSVPSPRSASPKRQRYPPPQSSTRRGLRSARGQGSPTRDGDFRRSLSQMREAARPYPTLTSPVEPRSDDQLVAPQASDDCNTKGLRRSPRFRQAAVASSAQTNTDSAIEKPNAGEPRKAESVKGDALMDCFATAVNAESPGSPENQSQHRATASTPFSTIPSPWSPAEISNWTGDDSRHELDYDMHSYLGDQSFEGPYAADSMGRLTEDPPGELVSPSHAALGFFAPFDERGTDADQSIVDLLQDKQSFFDALSRSYMPAVDQQLSPWKQSNCGQDLSFEYLSKQPPGVRHNDFIELHDVSWRKRRQPHDVSSSMDMEQSASCCAQLPHRQNLQQDGMSYTCSPSPIDRQDSTRTITQGGASQDTTHADYTQESSSVLAGSRASQSELPDYSLPLEFIDFSFDHRDGEAANDMQSREAMCSRDNVGDCQDDSMITWADADGPPALKTPACHSGQPDLVSSQMSPVHANKTPPWTRQHSKIAKFLLQQSGQEDTIPSVSSSNCTSPRMSLCGIESYYVNKTFRGEESIDPSMTLTHGGSAMPKGSTNSPQRKENGCSISPHRDTIPAVAKYDFINSALPRSAQSLSSIALSHGTSDTTSPTVSPVVNGPTSFVGERAAQWEAMTRRSPQAFRSPTKHAHKVGTVEEEESPQLMSPTSIPSAASERLELNGFYTEEELMDLLARRRMQRAAGRERER